MPSRDVDRDNLASLLHKINACIDYQTMYCLEDDFNKVGLTIQTTSKNRIVLCKLRDGKVISDKPIDDYIFLRGLDVAAEEVTDRALSKIVTFINNAAGGPDKVKNVGRKWQDGLRMYEQTISIMHDSTSEEEDEDEKPKSESPQKPSSDKKVATETKRPKAKKLKSYDIIET